MVPADLAPAYPQQGLPQIINSCRADLRHLQEKLYC